MATHVLEPKLGFGDVTSVCLAVPQNPPGDTMLTVTSTVCMVPSPSVTLIVQFDAMGPTVQVLIELQVLEAPRHVVVTAVKPHGASMSTWSFGGTHAPYAGSGIGPELEQPTTAIAPAALAANAVRLARRSGFGRGGRLAIPAPQNGHASAASFT
jgi:hypothetical protein